MLSNTITVCYFAVALSHISEVSFTAASLINDIVAFGCFSKFQTSLMCKLKLKTNRTITESNIISLSAQPQWSHYFTPLLDEKSVLITEVDYLPTLLSDFGPTDGSLYASMDPSSWATPGDWFHSKLLPPAVQLEVGTVQLLGFWCSRARWREGNDPALISICYLSPPGFLQGIRVGI